MLHDWSVLTRTARDAPLALHLHISKTGGTTPHKNARPGLAGTEGGSAHYDLDANTEITELTGWLVDDLQLYAHALRLFFDDVRRAEESVGVHFLCAGNGIAAAPYQRWPHRPRAFDAAAK